MNTTALLAFEGHKPQVIESAGKPYFTGEDVGRALDYEEPRKAIGKIFERNREALDRYSCVVSLTSQTQARETRIFDSRGVMFICMKSNQPKAVAFQHWALEILDSYLERKQAHANRELVDMQRKYILALEHLEGLKVKTLTKSTRFSDDELKAIVQLSLTGLGGQAIARRINRSIRGVQGWMRKNGIRRATVAQTLLAFGVQS